MISFQQFLEEQNGEYIEIAGSSNARFQCVDLVNEYIRSVLGLPIIKWTNAIDFISKAGSNYEFIQNSTSNYPLQGDIVIWGGNIGHIAIAIEGNANSFKSLDQNWPTGTPAHVVSHNYNNVLGWLQPKKTGSTELAECLKDREKFWKERDEYLTELDKAKANLANVIKINDEYDNEIEGLKAQITTHENFQKQVSSTLNCPNQPTDILGQITRLLSVEDQLRTCIKNLEDKNSSEAVCQQERSKLQERVDNALLVNKDVLEQVEALTKEVGGYKGKYEECASTQKYEPIISILGLYICKVLD
jgi:hypothetical protein